MNKQETYDRVCSHLLTQRARSVVAMLNGPCAYRGEGGLTCAIGCLIEDKYYHSDLEGGNVFNPDVRSALKNSGVNLEHESLLASLQTIHDHFHVEHWEYYLKELAEKEDLVFKGVTS